MKTLKTKAIFSGIVTVQKQLEQHFQESGVELKLVTIMNNAELPSFGSDISDNSGKSLDIEFKSTKNDQRLIVHLFNKPFFMMTINDQVTSLLSEDKLAEPSFLYSLGAIYSTTSKMPGYGYKETLVKFMEEFGR